ncbi:MAG: hypothetical protein ABSD58_08025 [Verrucomicrobiia bacterium]|jgi:hypothetical protein
MSKRSISAFRRFFVRKNAALRAGSDRGVALILTLAILALVTLLLIAFVTSMRVENAASKNFNELIKARELAQAGVDEAVGIIRMYAPPVTQSGPGFSGTNYVTAPGAIYAYSPSFLTSTHWTNVALFTSDPLNQNGDPTKTNDGNEVDLNANNVITGVSPSTSPQTYPTNGVIPHLWVGWSNVVTTVSGVNQLVGRYAYWVDDESAKVNLNVASSRGNDLEGYTPAAIDLWTLFHLADPLALVAEVGSLTSYVQNTRPLDTIQEAMMVSPPLPSMPSGANAPSVIGSTFSNTQFYVTTRATSPDLTPWGDLRLNTLELSNMVANAGSPQAAVQAVYTYLNTEDSNYALWTGTGTKFASKYNLLQIAANIVDYIGYPGTLNIPTDSLTYNSTVAPTYLGLKETPYLNELVISNTFQVMTVAGSSPPQYYLLVNSYPLVELWYMYGNSQGWTAAGNPQVLLLNNGLGINVSGVNPNNVPIPAKYPIKSIPNTMGPNTYAVVPTTPVSIQTATLSFSGPLPGSVSVTLSGGTITAIFTTQVAQNPGQQGRMDFAVIPFSASKPVNIPTTGVQKPVLWASQCNDPRVKPINNTWVQNLGAPTLGAQNSVPAFNLTAGSGTITGDGDTSCHTNSVNLIPNTTGVGRQRGAMTPGELAFIHTGVPWRTFSLQPWPPTQNLTEPGPPDWALLDFFSSGVTLATDVVGRININQAIDAVVYPPSRLGPLSALLTNLAAYSQSTATQNVYRYPSSSAVRTPSQLGVTFCPAAYTMVGEVANTQDLSNFGTTPSTPKSVLETPVRDIANIITTRSNTFTIWCLAQAVKKVDKTVANLGSFTTGVDVVTGEAKLQAIVERTVVNDALGNPTQVKFRTLYYRYYYQ